MKKQRLEDLIIWAVVLSMITIGLLGGLGIIGKQYEHKISKERIQESGSDYLDYYWNVILPIINSD